MFEEYKISCKEGYARSGRLELAMGMHPLPCWFTNQRTMEGIRKNKSAEKLT